MTDPGRVRRIVVRKHRSALACRRGGGRARRRGTGPILAPEVPGGPRSARGGAPAGPPGDGASAKGAADRDVRFSTAHRTAAHGDLVDGRPRRCTESPDEFPDEADGGRGDAAHQEADRLDYLSFSLSPAASKESFYRHESVSYTPSKTVEELEEDDLRRIVENENNCKTSQEDPKSYNVGGYMPISEGDILGNKYEVCRKLGYGQFSTVWLCQIQVTNSYVAIKVSKSQLKLSALAKDEIKLLECTNSTNPDHPGFRNIVQMFDYFCCQSINGNHTAIVLEVMGPSLLHLIKQSEYRGVQIPGVRRIIKQVLQGLEYLHDECGIIHTDLKPENILIKAKEPYIRQMVSTAKKFNELGIALPKTYVTSDRWNNIDDDDSKQDDSFEEVQCRTKSYPEDPFLSELVSFRRKHAETKLTGPMWIDVNVEVKIGDMGNATWVNNKYNSTIQTRQYRALEVILDAGYDTPSDIWSVGCLAFELATGEFLFYPKMYNNFSLDVDHITLIWEVLGGIPKYITKRGAKSELFFTKGKLRHIDEKQLRIWKIEDVLVDKYKWKRLDAIPFASLIEYLIEPDPGLRYTASQALSCEWINE